MENKFLDAMMFRHACKEFDANKKISEDQFNQILESGRLSPSSFGTEPWRFLVIQNDQLRQKLKEFTWGAQGTLPTASHFVIILARKTSTMTVQSSYVQNLFKNVHQFPDDIIQIRNGFYKNFQENDFKLLSDEEKMFAWTTRQTYIAMANMMTCAAYMEIDSCPIEGFNQEKASSFLKESLHIDTSVFDISVMVAFGYRKNIQKPKTRQTLETITAWYN
ncbi:MAG: NAD(P)H-dependent oxidoreductase [Campylobacterales bacterium]|nr:NAD(P)H-dependent oxidoreductase [Campylobacterales bacterium]